jgi:hypothetical protein
VLNLIWEADPNTAMWSAMLSVLGIHRCPVAGQRRPNLMHNTMAMIRSHRFSTVEGYVIELGMFQGLMVTGMQGSVQGVGPLKLSRSRDPCEARMMRA